MFKSKITIILLIVFLLAPFPAYAQTNTNETQLRILLLRVIDLLYQQIALLQAQIIELQSQQRTTQVQIIKSVPQDPLAEKKAKYSELQRIYLEVTSSQVNECREDSRNNITQTWWFLECISPSSPYHKTPEQLNAYKELKKLESEINNWSIPR